MLESIGAALSIGAIGFVLKWGWRQWKAIRKPQWSVVIHD